MIPFLSALCLELASAGELAGVTVPKRLGMTFVCSAVTKAQLVEAYDEGLGFDKNAAAVRARFQTLDGHLTDVVAKEVITFDDVPGTGTTVIVKGVTKGTPAT